MFTAILYLHLDVPGIVNLNQCVVWVGLKIPHTCKHAE